MLARRCTWELGSCDGPRRRDLAFGIRTRFGRPTGFFRRYVPLVARQSNFHLPFAIACFAQKFKQTRRRADLQFSSFFGLPFDTLDDPRVYPLLIAYGTLGEFSPILLLLYATTPSANSLTVRLLSYLCPNEYTCISSASSTTLQCIVTVLYGDERANLSDDNIKMLLS